MSPVNLRRSTRIRTQSKRFEIDYADDIEELNVSVRRSRRSNANAGKKSAKDQLKNKDVVIEKTPPEKPSAERNTSEEEDNCNYNTDKISTSNDVEHKCEDVLEITESTSQKPLELFAEQDINGKRLYTFSTPTRKDGMTRKAMLCRTPVALNTSSKVPKVLPTLKIVLEKIDLNPMASLKTNKSGSPLVTRELSSKRQHKYVINLSTSDSESISEESDYCPSESSEDDNTGSEDFDAYLHCTPATKRTKNSKNITLSDSEEQPKKLSPKTSSHPKQSNANGRRSSRYKVPLVTKNFHMKADDYFESQSRKVITSNNTLAALQTSQFTEKKLQELLASDNYTKNAHKKSIQNLSKNYRKSFKLWDFIMRQGYSVLLYGLGSKRNLINDFHKIMIFDYPTLVVNGFFPSLSIKDILDGILTDLLELETMTNPNDCVDLISETLNENPNDRMYLLVHNIDGIMLRTNKSQNILSRLASIPNLHLIASIDHINAPLMWDHVKRSRYNFCWCDASTFLIYKEETSYENSLLVQQKGALALSSLHNVFRSLTMNARAIYKLLVKYQLSNSNNSHYPGMPFKEMYRAARENFLVSSDLALRAQLTEFIDHKLVRSKRHIDGAEYLIIPLNNALLKEFLEDQDS